MAYPKGLPSNAIVSFDIMKWTKDQVMNQPNAAALQALMTLLKNNFPMVTHVCFSTPMNLQADMASHNSAGYPLTNTAFTDLIMKTIHDNGYGIYYRNTNLFIEGGYGFTGVPHTSTYYINAGIAWLTLHQANVKSGDIVGFYPESDSDHTGNNPPGMGYMAAIVDPGFTPGTIAGNAGSFNNLYQGMVTAVAAWSASTGIHLTTKMVASATNSTYNGTTINPGPPPIENQASVAANNGYVEDFYGWDVNEGITHDDTIYIAWYKTAVDYLYNLYSPTHYPFMASEWGDIRGTNSGSVQSADPYLTANICYQLFFPYMNSGEMNGINLWNFFDTPQEGILDAGRVENNGDVIGWVNAGKPITLNPKGQALAQVFQAQANGTAPPNFTTLPTILGGLNLTGYATSIGQQNVEVLNGVWVTIPNDAPVNLNSACAWTYNAPDAYASESSPGDLYSYVCYLPANVTPPPPPAEPIVLGGLNLNEYAESLGLGTSVNLVNNVWTFGENGQPINMTAACVWTYDDTLAYAQEATAGNAYTYQCLLPPGTQGPSPIPVEPPPIVIPTISASDGYLASTYLGQAYLGGSGFTGVPPPPAPVLPPTLPAGTIGYLGSLYLGQGYAGGGVAGPPPSNTPPPPTYTVGTGHGYFPLLTLTSYIPTVVTPPGTYIISGTVVSGGGTPYQGATVTIGTQSMTTDVNGNYVFANLSAGTYTVTLTVPTGYTIASTNPVTITISANTTVNFAITINVPPPAPTYVISGNVYYGTNTGYAGAVLSLTHNTTTTNATTDMNGNYAFSDLVAGNYTLSLSIPNGYTVSTTNPITVVLSANTTENFKLTANAIPPIQPPPPIIASGQFGYLGSVYVGQNILAGYLPVPIPITINSTAPVTILSVMPLPYGNGTYADPSTIFLSATPPPGKTIIDTFYTLDGGNTQVYLVPFQVAGQGQHIITYYSIDSADEIEVTNVFIFSIVQPIQPAQPPSEPPPPIPVSPVPTPTPPGSPGGTGGGGVTPPAPPSPTYPQIPSDIIPTPSPADQLAGNLRIHVTGSILDVTAYAYSNGFNTNTFNSWGFNGGKKRKVEVYERHIQTNEELIINVKQN